MKGNEYLPILSDKDNLWNQANHMGVGYVTFYGYLTQYLTMVYKNG